MPERAGHIQLERRVDSITVGVRHRKDRGDIAALARSIDEVGILQPITITPDGVLVCGWRRLEAVRRLGWSTLKVWVRSGISDELSHLLAQQDENEQRKPLTELETAHLYAEVKQLMAEDAQRRQAATRFGAAPSTGGDGAGDSPAPRGDGDSRAQAARTVAGRDCSQRLEHINWIESVTQDEDQRPSVRQFATNMLTEINTGAPVDPAYKRVKAAVELAASPSTIDQSADQDDLAQLAREALARVQHERHRTRVSALKKKLTSVPHHRSLRSFVLTWTELEGWTGLYDVDELAASLPREEWERFERVMAETVDFHDRLRAARHALASA